MYQIEKISTHGMMSVYRRLWREYGMRRFFVIRETDGRILEEFRRKKNAVAWALAHANG